MYFDTHAHYDDPRFDEDREVLLGQQLPEAGISLVVNCGCDPASSRASVALAERYDYIYAAVGCHPQSSEEMTDADLDLYAALTQHPKVKAIGEIGLDYHYDYPREIQLARFEDQLRLAADLHMPVVVHEREAHADAMALVRKYAGRVTGVFHCYSGALEQAKELVRLGWYLGFTGAITFKNARKAPEVLEWVPLQRVFIETDCPYMAPEPFRGRRNDPGYLYRMAERLAELRGVTPEEMQNTTLENGKRLYRLN